MRGFGSFVNKEATQPAIFRKHRSSSKSTTSRLQAIRRLS
jgi:hypothetical protein